jgi:hypothetical protein
LVDLVTSVPDLHTARILASGGVSYISFLQTNPNLNEIIPWIEGPEIFVQLINPDWPVPPVQGLIIPYEWYDQFSFMNKKIFWSTDHAELPESAGIIYNDREITPIPKNPNAKTFYHYSIKIKYNPQDIYTWIDFDQDLTLFENLFLD